VPEDHRVRLVWRFVEGLDVTPLQAIIKSVDGHAGHPAADPRILLALWLYATVKGIGSARELARLCEDHIAYRWLCGGVGMNAKTLADFRVAHGAVLERLLVDSFTSLVRAGVASLHRIAQDGMRVRAAAGAASFRRHSTLEACRREAEQAIQDLRARLDADPGSVSRQKAAARQRAVEERERRVRAALAVTEDLQARQQDQARLAAERAAQEAEPVTQKARQDGAKAAKGKMATAAADQKPREPRASTTDAAARVMKMADGGFRPAYNCQVASVAEGQIAIAVDVTNVGSDRGLMRPMQERLADSYGRAKRYLVDGGFNKNEDIEWAASQGIKVYGPPANSKHGTDPYTPRLDDGPGMAAWRRRMKSPHGKGVYKRRAPGECINARFRNWGLRQFTVRGREKVLTVLRWFALANNVLAEHRLRARAA